MAKKLEFVHCHVHSEFSMLDGLATIDEYVERAVRLKQPALALTDHGNICGAPQFYHACRKVGIEPVVGEEFYYVPDAKYRPEKGAKKDPGEKMRHHVGILARGRTGYQVLAELSTETFRNFYHKPLLDRSTVEALGKDTKHLTVLSGCAASTLARAVLDDDMDTAIDELTWWREHFPHYYIELMHHGTNFDDKLNKGLIKLAKRYKLPWVITNDPHYAHEHDAPHHDALLAIQTAADIDNPDRFRFSGRGYHLRSANAMRIAFKHYGPKVYEPGMANSVAIAKDCQLRIPEWETRTWHIPKFPDVDDAYTTVRQLAKQELKRRGLDNDLQYVDRLKMELKVIKKVGISDFLLITLDIIEAATKTGIRVGPGRGSVCGTLVGFLIGLHKIDPVKYDLLFERFLNPARPRMPDIDTDFGQARRSEVFDYITNKYGRQNVMHICTYGHMRNKAAFQSLAAAYGIPFADRIRISKDLAPKGEEEEDYLPAEIRDNYPDLAAQLERLSGIKRAISTHPAGVIIADPSINIRKLIPELYIPSSQKWVAQYDLEAVEEMGLLKEDILGLRTLDTIQECIELIYANTGERIEPDGWIPDEEPGDAEAYAALSAGSTTGVFQMEGGTNALGIQAIKCTCFEDIVSCTSLYRTGPIMAGYPEQFLNNRKAGKIKWAHPLLKPVLGRTWGVILYQEQVMEIAATLAGFDMVMVDDIKEAIKHKKSALMESLRPKFIKGCRDTNDIDENVSEKIWADIEGYSGYSYNRSHAVAYSMTSYQTLKLKHLYPLEYHTALIRTVPYDDKARRQAYLVAAVRAGFKILPPDINRCEAKAVPIPEKNAIMLGLVDYAGIGFKLADRIVSGRPRKGYKKVAQVAEACNNVKAMDVLARGSALTCLGVEGNAKDTDELLTWSFTDTMKKWRTKYKSEVILPERDGDDCVIIGELVKCDKRKTKTNKDYMTWQLRWSPTQTYTVRLWSGTDKYWKLKPGTIVAVSGKYEQKWGNLSVGDSRRIEVLKKVATRK